MSVNVPSRTGYLVLGVNILDDCNLMACTYNKLHHCMSDYRSLDRIGVQMRPLSKSRRSRERTALRDA